MKLPFLNNVRWRIAAMFTALSSVLYLSLALLAIAFFDWSLNHSIDSELEVQASELGHAIEIDANGTPRFRNWLRVAQTKPSRSLAAIQLYNIKGELIEQYGLPGPMNLLRSGMETGNFRVINTPLHRQGKLLGYLQIALPIAFRDDAMQKLELTLLLLAPALLVGLGLTGYVVSDAATAPIRNNLNLLKQFVADASHELNTPITIIEARTDILQKKVARIQPLDSDKERVNEDLEIISSTTERMQKIVEDLMLLAEVEGVPLKRTDHSCRLDSVIKATIDEFAVKFDDKELALKLGECQALIVPVCRENMHKVVSNLVENAWRYTEPGGLVTISLRQENGEAKIEVSDNGIGIPGESLPLVFDRFYRVDKSRSRQSGGSGLGLSIVKAIVEANKGRVYVKSRLNEGSTFTIHLPLARSKAHLQAQANSSDKRAKVYVD